MTTAVAGTHGQLRVGDVAEQTGTTARTIRYYEEIGLLTPDSGRRKGGHRLYTTVDVERVREVIRLRDLLGLSLEQLGTLLEVESVRKQLKDEWAGATDRGEQRRILGTALSCAQTQLELVHRRQDQLAALEDEVRARKSGIEARLASLR